MKFFIPCRTYGKTLLRLLAFLLLPFASFAQPANDVCGTAFTLITATDCGSTSLTGQTLRSANATAGLTGTVAPCGAINPGGADAWYRFTPETAFPIVSLTGIGSNLSAAGTRIYIYAPNAGDPCNAALMTPVACNSGTGTALTLIPGGGGLTPGNAYLVRVSLNNNTTNTAAGAANTWNFDICITEPLNDLCGNAIQLYSSGTCINEGGTLTNSTYTTIPTLGCGVGTRNDVWYKFVAQTTNPSIVLSSAPANPRIQLFSGSCTSLASISCSSTGTLNATGLTIGTTYFIRIYTDPNVAGTFNICITDPAPANDNCATPVTLTPGSSCTPTAGTLAGSTYTGGSISNMGCGTTNRNDVWYRFTATTTNPTISVSSLTTLGLRAQLFTATCGSLVSNTCGGSNNGTGFINATGLAIGTAYFIRVYADPNVTVTTSTFTVCVTENSNDECNNSTFLTSATTCSNISGSFFRSTASSVPAAPCTSPVVYDVWYYFTAAATNTTVTMSTIGAGPSGVRMQMFSGVCGALTSIACGNTSVTSSALIIGEQYWVRCYATAASALTAANSTFNICATFTAPVPPVPANDACAGAIVLPVYNSCAKTMGSVVGSTTSAVTTGACGGTVGYDVWYRFVATSTSTNVSINDFGANFTNRRLQVFSVSCAGSSISCTSVGGGNATVTVATTIGVSYFVRLWSTSATPTHSGDFSICITNAANAQRSGNSYVNVSKQSAGGVVEPNDTLEIRMTINHTSGSIYYMRYVDNVPTNTQMLTGAADRIRVTSNEGFTLQAYTPGPGDDAATYIASPPSPQYQIRMNLGFNNTPYPPPPGTPVNNTSTEAASADGQLSTGNLPNVFGNALFATAFRVRVTGVVGDTITLGTGKFVYKATNDVNAADIELTTTPYKILISAPMNLCPNSVGINMSEENGGTFGSGTTLNRSYDLTTPISGYAYAKVSDFQQLNDGQYAIVKNISPRSSINQNAERQPIAITPLPSQLASANRMHGGHWDIDGDHTGTNNNTGNGPQLDGVTGGYMLMVNADYVASEAYRQTLSNLCPNTYYEFSAWFRNICPTCGNDYLSTNGNMYTPRKPGVMPNLTFALDGLDRYNTGEIPYYSTGSVANGWVKKGFVFVTGPSQTSATLSIRNNSQGGGGNDWVMDDVTVATCLPSMFYSPTVTPSICAGTYLRIRDTVRSFFNNYIEYRWQRSDNGGTNWVDLGTAQTATPTLINGQWQFITQYIIHPADATVTDDNDLYRVLVATNPANLSNPACQVTDVAAIITLDVIACGVVLKTDLLSFNGSLVNDRSSLNWTTSQEGEPVKYLVERSLDGSNFTQIGVVNGYNNDNNFNQYSFIDPTPVSGKVYYRVIVTNTNGEKKYTRIIQLSKEINSSFALTNLINPFSQSLEFDISAPASTRVDAEILDMFGKIVKRKSYQVQNGINMLRITDTESLSAGTYILRVRANDQIITKKVVKKNIL